MFVPVKIKKVNDFPVKNTVNKVSRSAAYNQCKRNKYQFFIFGNPMIVGQNDSNCHNRDQEKKKFNNGLLASARKPKAAPGLRIYVIWKKFWMTSTD